MLESIWNIFESAWNQIIYFFDSYGPMFLSAGMILLIGWAVSYGVYKFVYYIFHKIQISERIEHLWKKFEEATEAENAKSQTSDKTPPQKQTDYAKTVAKAFGYYIFLLFFRWAIVELGITDIENFLDELISYLPSLFIGIVIGVFWVRFANTVYNIVYRALEITGSSTSKIVAMGAKITVLFFTLMIVLKYIKIVDENFINILFIGFVTMITLSFSLAFGLWGRDIAKEILESFRK